MIARQVILWFATHLDKKNAKKNVHMEEKLSISWEQLPRGSSSSQSDYLGRLQKRRECANRPIIANRHVDGGREDIWHECESSFQKVTCSFTRRSLL